MHRAILLLVAQAVAQSPGNGISKSTYSSNDPVAGWKWLYKYFPVATPEDECDNNICICSATSGVPQWEIQQGRVYAKTSSGFAGRRLASAGNGFGIHLVNVSNHLTTGGMTTAEVEAQFTSKLGNMSTYDSFMDHSITFYTSDVAGYAAAFDKDKVPYYATTWQSSNAEASCTYTSLIVQVPNTQVVLELTSKQSLALGATLLPVHVAPAAERRASLRALAMIDQLDEQELLGGIITPISVNRAVSAATLAKLDDFYVAGMGTTKVSDDTDASNGSTRKCYLWPGAKVDICFTNRPEDATKGNWKVGDYEDMLNTVHKNIIVGYPYCGMDKWEDNHYAIDSQSADTSKIVAYVDANKVPHICQSGGSSGGGSTMHYAFDPTGFGIQLDLGFATAPSDCSTEVFNPLVRGTFNPACDPGTCASSSSPIVV